MSEAHLNTYRCPDEECSWTLTVPTGPDVVPDAERYQGLVRDHLVTVHGVEVVAPAPE